MVCTGELTVDQNIIPIGSNLTVHCRSNTVKCGRIFVIKVGVKEVLRQSSCSSVTTQVVVNEPKFMLYCIAEQDGEFRLVCGRDIIANRMFILFLFNFIVSEEILFNSGLACLDNFALIDSFLTFFADR